MLASFLSFTTIEITESENNSMPLPFKAIGEIVRAVGKMAEKMSKLGTREVPKRAANIGYKASKSKKTTGSADSVKNKTAAEPKSATDHPKLRHSRMEEQSFKTPSQRSTSVIRTVQIAEDGSRIIKGPNFDIKIPPNISLTPEKSELILVLSRGLKTGSTKELLSQGFTISGNTITKQTPFGLLEGKTRINIVPESPGHPTLIPRTIIELIKF